MPLHEVNACSIPDIKDFTLFLGSLPQRVDGLAFETAHVVFLFARDLVVDGQVTQTAAAKIARIEMAHSVFFALAIGWVM